MRRRWRLLVLTAFMPWLLAAASNADLFSYIQRPGTALPGDAILRDEAGRATRLDAVAPGLPTIVALGYFHCPDLCGITRADLYAALDQSGLVAGRDYALLAVSIDPSETDADAAAAKRTDLGQFPLPGAADGWHFLTGSAASVARIAAAVGFRDRFDATAKQFLHPAGLVFATPSGVVSGYLLGVGYQANAVRAALDTARTGGIAAPAPSIFLSCFHFDPATGRYTVQIMGVLRLAGGVTAGGLVVMLVLALIRERRRRRPV